MKKLAVLSRFKEANPHFEQIVLEHGYDIIKYEKHDRTANSLPNIGREGHTFLHYIVENYYDLPDEILFSQYDPMDHFKWQKKENPENNVRHFLNKNLIDFIGIKPTDFDLIVRRRNINWTNYSAELFGNLDEKKVDELLSCGSTLNGVFRVSKNAILKNDINLYKKGLEMLSRGGSDPDEGFFFERIWKFLFMGHGCEDLNYKNIEERIFRFGTNNLNYLVLPNSVKWKLNSYGHIKLSYDGTIRSNGNVSFYHHFNESYWLLRDDTLFLLDASGAGTSKFHIGNFYFQNFINKKITHIPGDVSIGDDKWQKNALFLSTPFWH